MSYLDQDSTNPFNEAANAEEGKKNDILKKWENVIVRILGQFMILESFATGLLEIKTKFNCNLLMNRKHEVLTMLNKLKRNDEHYWEEMKEYLSDYLKSNTHLKNREKAEAIKHKLETYSTTDHFYVCVYNYGHGDAGIYCVKRLTNVIECSQAGGCNAFIYRSREAFRKESQEFEVMKSEVGKIARKFVLISDLQQALTNGISKTSLIDGFTCLVPEEWYPAIVPANCPEHEHGPGWWGDARVNKYKVHFIIASFN